MNTFLQEKAKLAYSPSVHRRLMSKTVQTAFGGKLSPEARNTLLQGAVESDAGLRHPWLPWNDVQHAFPSVTKSELGREVRIMRNDALRSLSRALADDSLGKLRRNTMIVHGLLGLGHAQHAQMDVGAHNLKPIESAKGDPSALKSIRKMRRVVRSLPGYYGGLVSAAQDHIRSGLLDQKTNESAKANLDKLQPSKFRSDQATVRNASDFGKSLRSALLSHMRLEHGIQKGDAQSLISKRLKEFNPNRLERAAGRTLDTAQYAVQQMQRLARIPEVMRERRDVVTQAAEEAAQEAAKTAQSVVPLQPQPVQPAQDPGRIYRFLRKAGPGIGGAIGLGVGSLIGARRGKLLQGALAGLGSGATLGWIPDMAHGVVSGARELR